MSHRSRDIPRKRNFCIFSMDDFDPEDCTMAPTKNIYLRSGSDILADEFAFASSARGEISHLHPDDHGLAVEVAGPPKGMVG